MIVTNQMIDGFKRCYCMKKKSYMNLALAAILISGSLFSQSAQAGGTRGKLENIKKTQYAINCANLKRKHARLEEIYKYGGEPALRKAIADPDYWVSRSEIETWKGCQTKWWYQYL